MRKYIHIIWIMLLAVACQTDEEFFGASISSSAIRFEPIAGGATMYYDLPKNDEIASIQAKYINAQGDEVLKTGSYLTNSLEITGFNEARKQVKVEISLINHQDVVSTPITMYFDTEDSGPVAFFDGINVGPYWNGFRIEYECPSNSFGLAHIFYVGINPTTKKSDTLLLKTFPLTEGRDTLLFTLQQSNPKNTIVIRTEDRKGYKAKQQVWKDVEALQMVKAETKDFEFLDPYNLSLEVEDRKLGKKYLFDGDYKGDKCFLEGTSNKYNTFLAGPFATGRPFIFDFKTPKEPAQLRIHSILNIMNWPGEGGPIERIWLTWYVTKLPCSVTVYASNDLSEDAEWKEIGSFSQYRLLPEDERWCMRASSSLYKINTAEDFAAQPPCFIEMVFNPDGNAYRYMKFIVNDVFDNTFLGWLDLGDRNYSKYVSFNELEVYYKK
ncbi:MAG: DUF4959 domain-containing protein [Marinifilaceae bacterium]